MLLVELEPGRKDCATAALFSSVAAKGGDRASLVRFSSRSTHGGADLNETGTANATARSSTLRLDRTGWKSTVAIALA